MVAENEDEGRIKIPIRDKRKLHSEPGDDVVADAGPPEAEEASGDAALAEANEKAASYLEDLQRLKAEFDNYRKRTQKEQVRMFEAAAADIVTRMLGVLDNFSMAVASSEGSRDFDSMFKGVQMVYGEFRGVLENAGLEIEEPKGEAFDPNRHEAVLQDEGDGSGHLVVDEVLRSGYLFKGAVLRPAMVKVTQDATGAGRVAQ